LGKAEYFIPVLYEETQGAAHGRPHSGVWIEQCFSRLTG